MGAFFYGLSLQWKLDIRSKTLLITCYIVPLMFYAFMGSIFTSIMPDAKDTLVQSMTIFGASMGSFIGLPPSLVEIYGSNVKNVYKANGVPIYLGLVLSNISAFIHLFIMSALIYISAPIAFDAKVPENSGLYFAILAIFIAVSLSIASIIGLIIQDQTKTSMFSMLIFLPSIMLSGIMFPVDMLPKTFENIGKLFPAAWGYKLMTEEVFDFGNLRPLFAILLAAAALCTILLKRISMDYRR